jgi:signal transduction histidine kinase
MISITKRIHRAIFTITLVCIVVMVLSVLLVNESLESAMLQVEITEDQNFYLAHRKSDAPVVWQSPMLAIVHVPKGAPTPPHMPAVFAGLPIPFSDEIERGEDTYLVRIQPSAAGTLYIAKNITHFEDRATWFQIALGIVILVIVALSLLLTILVSRRIVRPLKRLTDQISTLPVGPNMSRIALNFDDSELHSIAETFNRFLDELEAFVKREQSLLNLASHELRTPIAVISGAIDVLEQRGQLSENDRATVARMRRACTEMGLDVNMLLTLARRQTARPHDAETIHVAEMIDAVLDDLSASHQARQRVTVAANAALAVFSDPAMVRMLLRNLIQNALRHTTRKIDIHINAASIDIADQGGGLTRDQQAAISGNLHQVRDGSSLNGLGLYIVTLMCERLGWTLDVAQTSASGTVLKLLVADILPAHADDI